MKVKKADFLFTLGGINLLFIASLSYLLVGCATTQSVIENSKRNIVIRNLLYQQEKSNIVGYKEIKASDIMKEELAHQKQDPIKPRGRSFITTWTQEAIALNPGLSLRKYTTTILSSKTGQKATYSTSFSVLNWQLSNFLAKRYYLKIKYLDKIIQEEATRKGYLKNYISRIKNSMRGYGHWSLFVKNANMRGNPYFRTLEEITYRAIAIYNLSTQSAKISTIAYYLQNGDFNEVDSILAKKMRRVAEKEADLKNARKYRMSKKAVMIYHDMYIDDLKKSNKTYTKPYYNLLPKKIARQRQIDAKSELKRFFKTVNSKQLHNGFEILQNYKDNKEMMNLFTIAIWNSGNKHPFVLRYSLNPSTCLEAGVNSLFNYAATYNNYRNSKKYLDNMAYDVSVLEKLNCPEVDIFKHKLTKAIKRSER